MNDELKFEFIKTFIEFKVSKIDNQKIFKVLLDEEIPTLEEIPKREDFSKPRCVECGVEIPNYWNQYCGKGFLQNPPISIILEEKKKIDHVIDFYDYYRARSAFEKQEMPTLQEVAFIFMRLYDLLKTEDSLVEVKSDNNNQEIVIVGDTHGQYFDTLNILHQFGLPFLDNVKYVFNGDIVDYWKFSIENLITISMLKLITPNKVIMLRGNHETRSMNRVYMFEREFFIKFGDSEDAKKVYDIIQRCFIYLPIAATINDFCFVCHGGIATKDILTLDDIMTINRFNPTEKEKIKMDALLWSDYSKENGVNPNKYRKGLFTFGQDIVEKFLSLNKLDLIIRSHQLNFDGEFKLVKGHLKIGKLITVHSSPNFVGRRTFNLTENERNERKDLINNGGIIVIKNKSYKNWTFKSIINEPKSKYVNDDIYNTFPWIYTPN